MAKKKSTHYVNNQEFLEAIIARKALLRDAEESGSEPPVLTNYLGECILKIATGLSYSPKFNRYTYKDEMILDAIENCILYFDKFDPLKSDKPFSYFTQIIWYAFLRRIAKEKRQTYIRGKILNDMPFDSFEVQEHDEDGNYYNMYIDFMKNNNIDHMIEPKKAEKKSAKTSNPLSDFIDEGL